MPIHDICDFDKLMTLCVEPHSGQISIFSLNYDSLDEQWLSEHYIKYENGFDTLNPLLDGNTRASQFENVQALFNQERNIDCHIHGSIFYASSAVHNTPSQYSLSKYEQPVAANGDTTLIHENDDGTLSFLGPIVVGANKQIQITEVEPFPIYHSLFTRDTITSRIFVIIGYGFHDDYIDWNLSGLFQTAKQGRLVIMIKPPDKTSDVTGHTKDRDIFEKFCELNTIDRTKNLIWTSDAVIWYRGKVEDAVKDEYFISIITKAIKTHS